MGHSTSEIKITGLSKRLEQLGEEYQAASKQLGTENNEVTRLRLQRQIDAIYSQMDEVEGDLAKAKAAASASVPTSSGSGLREVLVAHSPSDRDWVDGELLRQLQAANLTVTRYNEQTNEELQLAFASAHRLLIVLTSHWLETHAAEFQQFLSGGDNPLGRRRRVLLLLREACEVPAEIADLPRVDFTDSHRQSEPMAFLIKQLGGSMGQINQVFAKSATQALVDFEQLGQLPQLAATKSDFEEVFGETCLRRQSLTCHKRLHDFFQDVDNSFQLVERERKLVAKEVDPWDELENPALELRANVTRLVLYVRDRHETLPEGEIKWERKLERAQQRLLDAIRAEDVKEVERACEKIRQVVGQEPSRLNERIVSIADSIPLKKLVSVLSGARQTLRESGLNGQIAERLASFSEGVQSLAGLQENLSLFIDNHNCLQALDDEIRLYESSPTIEDIREAWVELEDLASGLIGNTCGDWLLDLRATGQVLSAELKRFDEDEQAKREGSTGLSDEDKVDLAKSIRSLFRNYRSHVLIGANQVDQDLLEFCEQLELVGGELERKLEG